MYSRWDSTLHRNIHLTFMQNNNYTFLIQFIMWRKMDVSPNPIIGLDFSNCLSFHYAVISGPRSLVALVPSVAVGICDNQRFCPYFHTRRPAALQKGALTISPMKSLVSVRSNSTLSLTAAEKLAFGR